MKASTIRAGVLCLLAIPVAWLAWIDAAHSYFSVVDPRNPPEILSSSPLVLLNASDQTLAGATEFDRSPVVREKLARDSIARQPLNSVAVRFLGGAPDIAAGKMPSANLLLLSERITRRDRWTQLLLAYKKSARGDRGAMDNFDRLLTVRPAMIAELMPQLLTLVASDEGRSALAGRSDRDWFTQLIRQATVATERPADLVMLLMDVEALPQSLDSEDLGKLSGRLAREGLFEEAIMMASAGGLDSDQLTSFSPNERNTDSRFAPLTWSFESAVDGVASIKGDTMHLDARPGGQFVALSRVTGFDPGSYNMASSMINVVGPPASVEWQMYCFSDGTWTVTWRSGLAETVAGSDDLSFPIPPTCPVQRWEMHVQGSDAQRVTSLDFTVHLIAQ